jgi:hypothetical protein
MKATSLQSGSRAITGHTNERAFNGAQWHGLLDALLQLSVDLNNAIPEWAPDISDAETLEDAWDAWRSHESRFLEQVHATAKEWVQTRRLPNLPSEVLYYLGLRHRAALNFVEGSFVSTERGPTSLLSFPSVSIQGFVEWLLTEWGDEHAIYLAFPEAAQS